MGATPRQRLTQIPLPVRSTEASFDCWGRIILTYLREDEQRPASFFILGSALHNAIERIILEDLDLDQGLEAVKNEIRANLPDPDALVLETNNRSVRTIYDDADRMVRQWFLTVHPDSEKRLEIYDRYQWPPKVELGFRRTKLSKDGVWGSVDAFFLPKLSETTTDALPPRIVDWKSAHNKINDDFQLQFYRYGLDWAGADAHFHMLDRQRKGAIINEAGEYDETRVVRKIQEVQKRKRLVLEGKMPAFNPSWYCNYCPVQHLCPADGDPRNRDRNLTDLKALLQSVEPMEEIDGLSEPAE